VNFGLFWLKNPDILIRRIDGSRRGPIHVWHGFGQLSNGLRDRVLRL